MFCEIDVLNDFAKITGKYLHQSLFFKKVADPQPTTLLKRRLRYTRFPFVKFLRTPFLQNTSGGCFCVWWKKKIYQKPFSSHFPIFQKFSFHFFCRVLGNIEIKKKIFFTIVFDLSRDWKIFLT